MTRVQLGNEERRGVGAPHYNAFAQTGLWQGNAMNGVLMILLVLGAIGAFDTLYFHEWKLKLPRQGNTSKELFLHSVRDDRTWRAWRKVEAIGVGSGFPPARE